MRTGVAYDGADDHEPDDDVEDFGETLYISALLILVGDLA